MIAVNPHHCISQPNIRINNRQYDNRKRERTPARRAEVKAWCSGKLCTCGCGRPANTPHHPHDGLYQDEYWADLRECEPWYHQCHHNYHHGLVRCPECGGWMKQGREKCAKCSGWTRTAKKPRHAWHSCGWNRGNQQCSNSARRDRICPYNSRDAPNRCDADHFAARKKGAAA